MTFADSGPRIEFVGEVYTIFPVLPFTDGNQRSKHMTRVSRGLILGLSICVLLAGAAFAGPTRTDGDPDRPQIVHPGGPTDYSVAPRGTLENAAVAQETRVQAADNWQVVLKVYLRWVRLFGR